MGVMMQAFYWDCPSAEGQEFRWWDYVRDRVASLATVGFTALWLPPASKAANIGGMSMGYDVYDYYDLGEYDQKGATETWFGARAQLVDLIGVAHDSGMQVYADVVFNHNSGGDESEPNPLDGQTRWTRFTPRSGRFVRDWQCFHPSPYETWDDMVFEDMPDLCHRNPRVYTQLIEHANWLLGEIGFDGFRYDCVKGYGGWMTRAIQELRGIRNQEGFRPFGVGELWDSERAITEWLDETNAWSDNPVSAFDFPLRDRLKALCDTYGFSLRHLVEGGTLMKDRSSAAVTFVENHDVARSSPIINDKMLAYAVILTHEGYPCVFWQDYYNWGLAQEDNQSGIAALVRAHEEHAGGTTSVLYIDDELYIMQRNGHDTQRGLIFVLNNRGDWNGAWVQTRWRNARFSPIAWRGRADAAVPQDKWSQETGWAEFWAPPRGYAVYLPNA